MLDPHVGEVNLFVLHLLSALASRLQTLPSSCRVTLLPSSALEFTLAKNTGAYLANNKNHSNWETFEFRSLQLPAGSASVSVRAVDSWSAVKSADVVFFPGLMAFSHLCPLPTLRSAFTSLLQPLNSRPYPPLSWADDTEHKDSVYSIFHAHMLPATWVSLQGRTVYEVAEELLRDKPDGQYRLKGSYSMCGACGVTVKVTDGACPKMSELLQHFVDHFHQSDFGLQSFIPTFAQSELRFFTIAIPAAAPGTRFHKTGIIMKTSAKLDQENKINKGIIFDTSVYAAVHPDSLACSLLVDQLQREYPDFFERIYSRGLHCLRFDMGYEPTLKFAFLNEFAAAPDAATWSAVHGQDLLWRVADQTIENICNGL